MCKLGKIMKINILTDAMYETLLAVDRPLCVSVFLPLGPNPLHYDAARIRLKNQLASLSKTLAPDGRSAEDGAALLRPLREACDALPRLAPAGRAVAFFRAAGDLHIVSLPATVPAVTLTSQVFAIEPLLPFREARARYLVLTLAENEVRLYSGSQYDIKEVDVPRLPHSIHDVLEYAHDYDETIQFHTGAPAASAGRKRPAQFHGQSGARGQFDQTQLHRFCEIIDQAITAHFELEDVPLILAGAQTMPNIYRGVNQYRNLVEETIQGGERELDPETIRDAAWKIIAPRLVANRDVELQRLQQAVAKSQAVTGVAAVRSPALEGRVAAVFVARLAENETALSEERNRAVVATLRHGGVARVVDAEDLPDPSRSAAAILRY